MIATKPVPVMRGKDVDRFWSNVAKSDGCWVWTGARNIRRGYGVMSVGNNQYTAHRLSYALHNGAVPDGLYVCHHCDNPPCVNPAHLYAGTARENVRDMIERGRASTDKGYGPWQRSKTHCPQGHEYDAENTYYHPKLGHRLCRTCHRERQAKRGREGPSRTPIYTKTHCVKGHEYTPENTYVSKSGSRACRTCHRIIERLRQRRIAESARTAQRSSGGQVTGHSAA